MGDAGFQSEMEDDAFVDRVCQREEGHHEGHMEVILVIHRTVSERSFGIPRRRLLAGLDRRVRRLDEGEGKEMKIGMSFSVLFVLIPSIYQYTICYLRTYVCDSFIVIK